jgi:serine/threonine-protein kinase
VDVGSRVGPYEIVARIGAGGMGTVYRAHDSRLGRDVAIKVSEERFTERFEREARAVAALNHPNICTLHDIGPDYLVMEFVEGETLADVLAQRASPGLPPGEAMTIARQIASALEAAHEKGIVHRDLKPGNIKVKTDGTVKILDFGLAKFGASPGETLARPDEQRLTDSPTIGVTGVGVILGTAAYMAPEQARGKAVDKRADIWAFGVVFYEMLTGRKPFDGEDASSVLASVIQAQPRWDGIPRPVERLLRACLEKDPKRRVRDIGDVWHLLDGTTVSQHATSGRAGWIAAGVFAAAAALAMWAPWRDTAHPVDRPLTRLEVELGPDVSLLPLKAPTPSSFAISPDGTRLVYVASVSGGSPRLFMRRLDQPHATEIAGTAGAVGPFFSPDGQWVGFYDGSRVNRISVEGGAVAPLMSSALYAGGTFTDGGDLIVGSGLTEGLLRMPSAGGTPETIVKNLTPGDLFFSLPHLLPGGNDVLVTVYGTPPSIDRTTIELVSLGDGSRKTIARGGTAARYLPTGHLIYANRNTMFAVPFDLDARETRGTPVPVVSDIAYDPAASVPQYDISRDGMLVYRDDTALGVSTSRLLWLDMSGKRDPINAQPAEYAAVPRISPDGKRLAMAIRDGTTQDIWVYDLERDQRTRLTFGTETFATPIWSPDGRFVVFGSIGNGLHWARADGGGQPQPLVKRRSISFPYSFSPDGTRIAFNEVSGAAQIWTAAIEQGDGLTAGEPERYMTTQFADTAPKFSPDGRWVAYESNETGRVEVYVRAFQTPASSGGAKWLISNNGGAFPVWSPDRRELLYLSGDQIMSVGYTIDHGAFVAGKPRVLLMVGGARGFDMAPDGRRVMAVMPTAAGPAPQSEHTLIFVQNFFDELRRRVPVAR